MVSALEIENSTIVFARVMEIWTGDSKNPLVYFDRKYFGL
jgi:flavin reductase (DIM6/NTAB) family NADH-FMN oxidoreductase RutF